MLAGVAIAAEVFRSTMRNLGTAHGLEPVMPDATRPTQTIRLAFPALALGPDEDIGRVDVVSAGAISTNCLYTLLRVPGLAGRLRIIDDDAYALTNLNRYPLMRRYMIGQGKAQALSAWANEKLSLVPLTARFDERIASTTGRLAPRVLVGVDNIRSRWAAQVAADDWLSVTGTSDFTVLDSEHVRGGPCAGCLHWRDEDANGEIPTISFVSALAGALQAYRLLARHTDAEWAPQVLASALNLSSRSGLLPLGLVADRRCALQCEASRRLP